MLPFSCGGPSGVSKWIAAPGRLRFLGRLRDIAPVAAAADVVDEEELSAVVVVVELLLELTKKSSFVRRTATATLSPARTGEPDVIFQL